MNPTAASPATGKASPHDGLGASAGQNRGRIVGPFFRTRVEKFFGLKGEGLLLQSEPSFRLAGDLRDDLAQAFGCKLSAGALRPPEAFDDDKYYLPSMADIRQVFDQRSSLHYGYRDGVLDCEDFAYWLKADYAVNRYENTDPRENAPFAVGILWGGITEDIAHTVNVAVTCDAGVQIIDATPPLIPEPIYPAANWLRPSVNYIVI